MKLLRIWWVALLMPLVLWAPSWLSCHDREPNSNGGRRRGRQPGSGGLPAAECVSTSILKSSCQVFRCRSISWRKRLSRQSRDGR